MNDDIITISGFTAESVVDGEGLRAVVFTQGCPHHCEGCHNPSTHPFEGGKEVSVSELAQQILQNPLLSGVTFSGGEPFCQPAPLANLASLLRPHGLSIVTYTGYTFEELIEKSQPDQMRLLAATDTLIDGKFIKSLRDLTLKFRGSKNQRILDCQQSLAQKKAVLAE